MNNKHELIRWLENNIPLRYASIHRHFRRGSSLEFLGGFKQIPPGNNPGWIFWLKDKYILAIISYQLELRFCMLDKIPWQYYENSNRPLYRGDFPEKYKKLKNRAVNENQNL